MRFWQRHRALLDRAEREFGVPPAIVVAIIGVETFYGSRTGSLRVLDSLATLAFSYPRRSAFFTSELEHFLLLVEEEGLDPLSVKGSYAGAMGIPSSSLRATGTSRSTSTAMRNGTSSQAPVTPSAASQATSNVMDGAGTRQWPFPPR